MSLPIDTVKKIAHLARLNINENDLNHYATQLTNILDFIAQMNEINTTDVEPLSHPLALHQRMRPDVVTEVDQRKKFQQVAPNVEAGLYLVPQVIE